MNTKKEILIGFIVGIIANTLGTLLYILIFSELSIAETFEAAVNQEHVGSLLALGAILNKRQAVGTPEEASIITVSYICLGVILAVSLARFFVKPSR